MFCLETRMKECKNRYTVEELMNMADIQPEIRFWLHEKGHGPKSEGGDALAHCIMDMLHLLSDYYTQMGFDCLVDILECVGVDTRLQDFLVANNVLIQKQFGEIDARM